jgi:hypothetical protein
VSSNKKFTELEEFVAAWGLPTAHERLIKRSNATMAEIQSFYDVVTPRLEEIIDFLNQYPIDDIPEECLSLSYTALAVCEIDDAVNVWHAPALDFSSDTCSWRVKKSKYDYQ